MSVTQGDSIFLSHPGRCGICNTNVTYQAKGPNLRSTLRCPVCDAVPRHRALFHVLNTFAPNWRSFDFHESSPGADALSARIRKEAKSYTATQWDTSVPFGTMHPKGFRSEDLQEQTFADGSFDAVLTQDVFEHIFHPDKAIKEIARTLRPGGICIMTVPIVRKRLPSVRRASLEHGEIKHHLEPQYHGNPVSGDGSLVTVDWGYDIVSYLQHHSGMGFVMAYVDNLDIGIRADLIEVLIGFKQPLPNI